MSTLKALLIIRPVNLLILAATQFCVYYFLIPGHLSGEANSEVLIQLVIASICLAIAGNMHNDLADVEPDQYNKPDRNFSVYWPSRTLVWVLYALMVLVSVAIPARLSLSLGMIFGILNVMLFLYNFQIKKIPVLGNLIIAFLSGFSLVVIGLVFPGVEDGPLFFYSGFAFLMTLIRELVKDAQDRVGDERSGYKTLPILIGTRRMNRVIANLTIFATVLLVALGYENLDFWFTGTYRLVVMIYGIAAIVLPMIYIVFASTGQRDVNYRLLSHLLKYVMVTGLASMLFF